MSVALPDNPLWILAALAVPPLLVVVPWRVGWLLTLSVFFWADSSMPGADIPRRIQVRVLVLAMLFVQGLVRLRGRGTSVRATLPVVLLAALASVSALWSDTRVPSAANAASLVLLFATCFLFVARYAPTPGVATQTVERAALWIGILILLGFVPRLHTQEILLAGRLRGFFGNPNGLGISCALIAPWVAIKATRSVGARRAALGFALAALVLLAFLSGSRTGLGGLVVGTATALFLRHPSRFLVGVVVLGVGISIATLARGGDVDLEEGAVGNFARTQTVSRLSGRLARWEEGFGRFGEAPLLGHGYKASWAYEAPAATQEGAPPRGHAAGVNYHSQHVETLVDLGIVGEVLLLLVLGDAWRRARSLARRRDDDDLSAAGAALAGTFVAAGLDSFFHNWILTPASPYAFFFWSLFALCLRLHRDASTLPISLPRVPPPARAREAAGVA